MEFFLGSWLINLDIYKEIGKKGRSREVSSWRSLIIKISWKYMLKSMFSKAIQTDDVARCVGRRYDRKKSDLEIMMKTLSDHEGFRGRP